MAPVGQCQRNTLLVLVGDHFGGDRLPPRGGSDEEGFGAAQGALSPQQDIYHLAPLRRQPGTSMPTGHRPGRTFRRTTIDARERIAWSGGQHASEAGRTCAPNSGWSWPTRRYAVRRAEISYIGGG